MFYVPEVDHELLGGLAKFLAISPEYFPLARRCGACEIDLLKFYENYVFPRIASLDPLLRDETLLGLIKNPELSEKLADHLQHLAFVPTSSSAYS
jgi:hypothetical protein